jgi:phosphoglycolate phosphatase-like HAD superfamily hydrolase
MQIRGVLLDVDGTLIDSNAAHAWAWVEALREHGIDLPYERVRRLIGMGGDKLLPEVSGIEADSPQGEAIGALRRQIFLNRYLPHLQRLPGIPALFERMVADGLRLYVASSAQPEELQPLLERAGALPYIEAAASSGDAERSKPDPDIIHAALERARLPSEEVVLIGDTPYDIEAAARARVATVAVRCGGWSSEALRGAIAVYDDPADLLAHYDESPLAPQQG